MTADQFGEPPARARRRRARLPEPILVQAPNPGLMTLDGTNTWVIPCPEGGIAVIDPGPADASHLAAIEQQGAIAAVLLTHRHLDHSAAVARISPRVPVYAAFELLARGTAPLRDGETVRVGGLEFGAMALPGHTADSFGFTYRPDGETPLLFTGDTLLGGMNSTLLVASDGGDLGDYLASLERVAELEGWRGAPGHGAPIDDLVSHALGAIRHRRSRLDELRAALAKNPRVSPGEVAAMRYPGDEARQQASLRMLEVELAHLRSE
ncbi:MBL fold metallo-hydrolase [Leucobacter sp. USHLN153]|uniref:MBL fold metallo-hydrolase n=1 Tax=Leucobacter sp. USHLN153 TaxID=3081268 RepID=UPI0030177C4F